MLTLRKAQIEQAIDAELDRLRVVEARLQQIDTHGQMRELDVVLKSPPAQPFLSLREVLPHLGAVRQRVVWVIPAAPWSGPQGQRGLFSAAKPSSGWISGRKRKVR
jgi:hypothetical protein